MTAYGLFVEHYEKDEVIWNGTDGTDIFFLAAAGSGGIDHVVDGTGGSSTAANPDAPVNVLSYP